MKSADLKPGTYYAVKNGWVSQGKRTSGDFDRMDGQRMKFLRIGESKIPRSGYSRYLKTVTGPIFEDEREGEKGERYVRPQDIFCTWTEFLKMVKETEEMRARFTAERNDSRAKQDEAERMMKMALEAAGANCLVSGTYGSSTGVKIEFFSAEKATEFARWLNERTGA